MDRTTESCLYALGVDAAAQVALVEERDNLVAGLEALDVLADGYDGAGAIGAGDNGGRDAEGVLAFGDYEVAVVEGDALDCGRERLVSGLLMAGSDFAVPGKVCLSLNISTLSAVLVRTLDENLFVTDFGDVAGLVVC